jgi:hypothetical protein
MRPGAVDDEVAFCHPMTSLSSNRRNSIICSDGIIFVLFEGAHTVSILVISFKDAYRKTGDSGKLQTSPVTNPDLTSWSMPRSTFENLHGFIHLCLHLYRISQARPSCLFLFLPGVLICDTPFSAAAPFLPARRCLRSPNRSRPTSITRIICCSPEGVHSMDTPFISVKIAQDRSQLCFPAFSQTPVWNPQYGHPLSSASRPLKTVHDRPQSPGSFSVRRRGVY